jgi:Fe-S cluster assembly protein SufD
MPATIHETSRPEDRFVAAFERLEGHTLNGSNARIQGLRKEAIQSFSMLGIPTRKSEAWKYTNIEKALRHDYKIQPAFKTAVQPFDVERFLIPGLDAYLVVLVNGRYNEELSRTGNLPEGVMISGFARAAETHAQVVDAHFARYADIHTEPLVALNTAFTQDGLFIYVPKGTEVERPVHILNLVQADEDVLLQPRNLVIVEEASSLRLIETLHTAGAAKTLTNAVTELRAGPYARTELYKLQDGGAAASLIDSVQVYQEASSNCSVYTFTFSGNLVRNNLSFLPDAEHCESHLFGLFLGKGQMHVDNHTLVDHAMPNCFSNELYKGVLDDESTGVFNGKVYVRRDAQKTNAYQSNKAIVLTESAKMYSKPELEIYADDVKCSHGATTGQLDPEAVFYLRSRGLSEPHARAMLLLAFARDVLENVKLEPLREYLDEAVHSRFGD